MKKRIVSMILCFALLLTYTPMTVSATEETTTIYFENTADWSVVNAYGWDSDNSSAAYLGSWPGTAMALVEDETSIYSIEVPTEVDNVIFNNGTVQTGDCAIPTDGTNLFTPGAVGEDGKYTGTWSAYGPTESDTARITDVTITVDGREYAGGDTATITFNSTVYFTVTGTNLDKLDSAAYIFYVWGTVVTIASGEGTSEQIRVSVPASDFTILTNKFEVCYHPGGEGDLIKTGLYVQYDTQGMDPKITGVKLTVDGTEYTEGIAVVRPTSAVTITILGENLNQISGDQNLNGILALDLNNEAWVTSEDGSERSATYSGACSEALLPRLKSNMQTTASTSQAPACMTVKATASR